VEPVLAECLELSATETFDEAISRLHAEKPVKTTRPRRVRTNSLTDSGHSPWAFGDDLQRLQKDVKRWLFLATDPLINGVYRHVEPQSEWSCTS
jgi:hypothetical protein